jgi:hypothetical protein
MLRRRWFPISDEDASVEALLSALFAAPVE